MGLSEMAKKKDQAQARKMLKNPAARRIASGREK